MSSRLLLALDNLISELTSLGSPLNEFLLPGLGAEVVRQRLESLKLVPPPDLLALFAWHNGYDEFTARGETIGPELRLPSLETCCDTLGSIRLFLDMRVEWGEIEHALWFPVLESPVIVIMDCNPKSAEFGRVVGYDPQDYLPTYRPYLFEPLERWAVYLAEGVWERTPHSWLDHRTMISNKWIRAQGGLP